jgi:hypothetical protein
MVLGERPGDIVEKWERVRSMEEQIAKESSKPKTKGKKKK